MMCLALSFSACSKKQVKKEGEIEESDAGGRNERMGKVEIGFSGAMAMIHFDFDQYTLTSAAQETLKKNAEWMKKNKNIKTQIEGHCDSRGTQEYNIALGQKRAETVRKYLADLGIPSFRLATISYGEEKPLDASESEEARANNRRAEFVITDK